MDPIVILSKAEQLLGKTDGRDKFTKIFQEALRAVNGTLADAGTPSAGLKRAQTTLGEARRTFRWLKLVSPLLALREFSDARSEETWHRWLLAVGTKVAALMSSLFDHIIWLQKHAGLAGNSARNTLRWKRCQALVHTLSMVMSLLKGAQARGRDAAWKHATELLRHFLLFLQDAHPAKLLITHDTFVGVVGVVASAWDVSLMWQKLAPPAKPIALAPPVAAAYQVRDERESAEAEGDRTKKAA